jgi:hypothetical protein
MDGRQPQGSASQPRKGSRLTFRREHAEFGVTFIHRYNTGMHKGFAAKITDQSVLEKLQNDNMVMDISVNAIVEAYAL